MILGSSIGAADPDSRHDPRVELDWLRTFLAVLDRGGFSAAASRSTGRSRGSARTSRRSSGSSGVILIDRTPPGPCHARRRDPRRARPRHPRGGGVGPLGGRRRARSARGPRHAAHNPVRRVHLPRRPPRPPGFRRSGRAVRRARGPSPRRRPALPRRRSGARRAAGVRRPLRSRPARADPVGGAGARGRARRAPARRPVRPGRARRGRARAAGGAGCVSADGVPEVLELLARRGAVASATATADSAATVAALVRSGIGGGAARRSRPAASPRGHRRRLVAVPLVDTGLVRRVYALVDVLLDTELGKRLLDEVLAGRSGRCGYRSHRARSRAPLIDGLSSATAWR